MRTTALDGREGFLVLTVPPHNGKVHGTANGNTVVFSPEDVSKLRRMLQLAQAVALDDRGRF